MLVNQKIKTLYIGKFRRWPNVGQMLLSQQHKTLFTIKKMVLAQRWPDVVQPTKCKNFGSAIFYVGPTLALRCKANTVKGVAFQISFSTC